MRKLRSLQFLIGVAAAMASLVFVNTCSAFAPPLYVPGITTRSALALSGTADNQQDDPRADSSALNLSSRRALLSAGSAAATALVLDQWLTPHSVTAAAEEGDVTKGTKVLVLGGTGFVGAQVVAKLKDLGVSTIATSRDGRDGTVALDVINQNNLQDRVAKLAQGCSAVIACIGAIGTANDETVNAATAAMAFGAKQAGVQRFVYITVAPEVAEFAKDIDFLKGYMKGKAYSRDAVVKSFGSQGVLIEPTFIYGGGSFELNPPRVASFYGKFIEGVLSSSPLRALTGITPQGFIKIALEPPVPVEAVASASIAGALGKTSSSVLDTYDKIKEASLLL